MDTDIGSVPRGLCPPHTQVTRRRRFAGVGRSHNLAMLDTLARAPTAPAYKKPRNRFEVAEARMGHHHSSRSGDDTSKLRRFGYMLVADPDYVLALYPYPYHTIPQQLGWPSAKLPRKIADPDARTAKCSSWIGKPSSG